MELKIFGKWSTDIEIRDAGLKSYINLNPVHLPHSGGRHESTRFWKHKLSIVERMINKVMRSGAVRRKVGGKFIRRHGGFTGKKIRATKIVMKAFEIIHERTKENPIQILVRAIENSSPREETTTLTYGGVRYHQSVDVSPQRRIDQALKYISLGASAKTFKSKSSYQEALAEEIILASENDIKSLAVSKRDEVERIAKSAR